jgi:hypothetical protein
LFKALAGIETKREIHCTEGKKEAKASMWNMPTKTAFPLLFNIRVHLDDKYYSEL